MKFWLTLLLTLALAACNSSDSGADRAAQWQQDAQRAYLYGYPLVLMERTRQVSTAVPQPDASRAPINQFVHIRSFPDPDFKDVVSPNVDTLYSIAWLDLKDEALVLDVPDAALYPNGKGQPRYYLLQMLDGWTNVFDSPGLRTRGDAARTYLLSGPDWQGTVPANMEHIRSPTQMVWITGRTQSDSAADLAAVHAFQDAIRLVPLSAWGQPYTPPVNVPVDPKADPSTSPVAQVDALDAAAFFDELMQLMRDNPAAAYDQQMLAALAALDMKPGQAFDLSARPRDKQAAIRTGYQAGKLRLLGMTLRSRSTPVNAWTMMTDGIGKYDDDYDNRAVIAKVGLGANLPEDAVYPRTAQDEQGETLLNTHRYALTFPAGQLPPAQAFWSLTLYDNQQALVANPLQRYAIGDRDALSLNPDGSLTLYIQKDAPAGAMANNWLPAPQGADGQPFNLIMRIYWPAPSVLNGGWLPPPLQRQP